MRPIRVRWRFKLNAFTQRNSRAINTEIDFLATRVQSIPKSTFLQTLDV